jgi:CheY-like chemotaxis protein
MSGGTRALLRGVNPSSQPLILVLDEVPARLEVLSAYFGGAGCAVIAVDDVEQALTICSVISPDLMVLPEQRPGMSSAGLARLWSEHPTCPIAVTSVLDTDADSISDTTAQSVISGPSMTQNLKGSKAGSGR